MITHQKIQPTPELFSPVRKIIYVLLLIATIFISHCSDRERLNPIDPKNPETGGSPHGLRIYSEYDRAVLQWDAIPIKNFLGYRIYRKGGGESLFQLIHLTPPDSNFFVDKKLNFGESYHYQISVLGGDFESARSDTVSVIPGPTSIWATDVFNRRIIKIAHDGAHEILQIPVDGYPWDLALDDASGKLWFADIFLNRVYQISDQIPNAIATLTNGEPIDIALDQKNDLVWVADETQGKIFVFSKQGQPINEISGFKKPSSIDCFFEDGSCWVSDSRAGTLTKISKTSAIAVQIKELFAPSSVSVNQKTGECWVADSSRVIKFDFKGNQKLMLETGLRSPTTLAVDSDNGNCWVLDLHFFANQSTLICFNEQGVRLFEFSGLTYPENLAINPYDHSCIVADSGNGRILKIASDGTLEGQLTGYDYPRGLAVEYMR